MAEKEKESSVKGSLNFLFSKVLDGHFPYLQDLVVKLQKFRRHAPYVEPRLPRNAPEGWAWEVLCLSPTDAASLTRDMVARRYLNICSHLGLAATKDFANITDRGVDLLQGLDVEVFIFLIPYYQFNS